MKSDLEARIHSALDAPPTSIAPLSGGCIGEVYKVSLEDRREVVVKVDAGKDPKLDIEGYMLDYLASHSTLPVPSVIHTEPSLLVMEFLPGDSRFSSEVECDAAELLAELHGISSDTYGLDKNTLIGGLHQPNDRMSSWVDFFREHRLLHMAGKAAEEGRMGQDSLARIENFAEKLDDLLEEPESPSLLHGDVWSTNVLAERGRISGFIDPAVYYGHPEIELAFITLFDTFGDAFFKRYNERSPIRPGFFESRREIYNLYPLLVHVRLFGGSYLESIKATLSRFGY